ncbi:hypothetical protein J2741_001800 [Methanolinea mesophila]|uniref:hypothetical protein n=1 Tax=Methanolinea mesophila TaxID=547055 RepID=UPI001AE872DA|nr:hypothetical protein [Methanolinea mesophila]MBP1929253.1 hypothetical protein [Methanolinea mesophila]
MKKTTAAAMVWISAGTAFAAWILSFLEIIPLWVYEAVLVAAVPLFVLSLGLWWMARENEPDIPFIGY